MCKLAGNQPASVLVSAGRAPARHSATVSWCRRVTAQASPSTAQPFVGRVRTVQDLFPPHSVVGEMSVHVCIVFSLMCLLFVLETKCQTPRRRRPPLSSCPLPFLRLREQERDPLDLLLRADTHGPSPQHPGSWRLSYLGSVGPSVSAEAELPGPGARGGGCPHYS